MRQEFKEVLDGLKAGEIMQTVPVYPWRTQWNSYELAEEGEDNPLPSITEPNQSLSLQTLLQRHVSGRPLDDMIRPGGYYDFDINGEITNDQQKKLFDTFRSGVPDLATMDLAERQELKKKTEAYLKAQSEELARKKAEKQPKKAEGSTPQPKQETTPPAPSAGVKTEQ